LFSIKEINLKKKTKTMTDIIIDDDQRTTSARRPMFIETEVRTDSITKRRVGSITSRSVHDILENTKSPTE